MSKGMKDAQQGAKQTADKAAKEAKSMTEKIKENVQDAADKVAKVCSITGNLQCSQTAQSGVALCAQTRVCAPALPS